ncbi:MAG: isocitrate lyase/phosphoenolpyruvate mutase family protein [Gemmatimonadaceae bacterium]
MPTIDPRIHTFRRLHESGTFVIPNPWDVGSARLLQHLGFAALATTSAGFAWTLGRPDNSVTVDEVIAHLRAICCAVTVPVNADFERGFATAPDEVAANVVLATGTGIAGLSIEDSTHDPEHPLFDFSLAVDRVRAAKQAIDATGTGVLLTARSEGFIVGRPDLGETIRRLTAFADAGADCLFAPGLRSMADIEAVVRAVAPKPVNVIALSDATSVASLSKLGVRRISVGSGLARTALSGFLESAREIAEHGTFSGIARAGPFAKMNAIFEELPS